MKKTKILVIRFSSIGDIVLTTPIVRALKEQVKGIELHYLTKAENEALLRNNKYIDKLHLFKSDLSQVIDSLRLEEFSYIVDLQKNFRSLRIKKSLGVRASSFPKLNFRKWLLVNCKLNMMPAVHIVDRYFEAVRDLEAVNDGRGLDYFLQESDIVESESLPEDFKSGYVACVVGSKHETKQMPVDLMVDLCNRINKPIILLGGKGDRDKASIIEHKVGTKVFNACGAYNINQSAYLLKHSLGIVTPDTGLMHIASAFDKNIVAVWGNTVPQFGMYPYRATNAKGKTCNFEVENLKCRPCSKLGYDKCPKGHFKCMQQQDVAKIAEIVNSWSED
ncbi:MAG: glycosyltransferase family 9 protein [Bacteroidales bacterium]|nr:glycosyltransferase family 9 protein [Bacteroidales bacterium]MBO7228160.1 glycosyltransferase family 9 protein [Bacteroidales bacterium]